MKHEVKLQEGEDGVPAGTVIGTLIDSVIRVAAVRGAAALDHASHALERPAPAPSTWRSLGKPMAFG